MFSRVKVDNDYLKYKDIIDYCFARFSKHMGVRLKHSTKHYVTLIPTSLLDDDPKFGLVIGYSGGGYYEYYAEKPLNKFVLVQRGFPLLLSEYISTIINALIKQYGMIEDQKKLKGNMPYLIEN